ncbi:cobalamin B12-binding domain-containing protein [Ruminococcus sp. CLA-AA-H200]|uniref:Cobalamin B12-binding domain-containing protein n=1 Tax=Ruminococcus turbiniformis TaxID=2881258 RepID=A0ABS8FWR5_9FIRM|nr:cobalamin B12-binding domain-containing protein [Ruminococcus turbiniformis]MCC2254486.1 cobalamin B12-binding domain-containing protein [Ruminococcus turbiniformis]
MGKTILDKGSREYIKSLIPDNIPDWKKVWEEGYEIGKNLKIKHIPFEDKYGMKPVDYRMKLKEEGKICWKINTGLATVKDQVEALKAAEKFNEETGLDISLAHQLPQNLVGVPKEIRKGLPLALGFMLDEPEDWEAIASASTVAPVFGDNHIGWPNAVETTINSVQAGSQWTGLFGTYVQVAPGCPDEVWNMTENVKALGIVAAKYDDKVIANDQSDDSYGAYFNDLATSLAWAKMNYYIVHDLCKARYSYSFGNFTQNIMHKTALWLAAAKCFNKDDQPGIGFVYPDTISHWDHHIHANYGFQIPEVLFTILAEQHFKAGCAWLSVPITEKVAIPTVPEMLDMTGACQRAQETTYYWAPMINWEPLEKLRDQTIELGDKMFHYMLQGLEEAGVDITNPIEIMTVLKAIDPFVLEKLFHPSIVDEGNETIVPLMPAALWNATQNELANQISILKDTKYPALLKGHRAVVASADVHFAGAAVIAGVMNEFGADVVDGGNQLEAIDVLDLADENNITDVIVSLHNGQALPYAKLIVKLAAERNKKYRFFFGGVLQSFLNEDDAEPSDVTEEIRKLGIHTCTTVENLFEQLTK